MKASHTHFPTLDPPAGDWDICIEEAHKHLVIFYPQFTRESQDYRQENMYHSRLVSYCK